MCAPNRSRFAAPELPRLPTFPAALFLTLLCLPNLQAADWPTISQVSPSAVEEGGSFVIHGQGFGHYLDELTVVIRDRDGLGGATTTLIELQNDDPADNRLTARVDPVGRHFTGDLELHVAETFHIVNSVLSVEEREYLLTDAEWVESFCFIDGGPFTVSPPKKSGQLSQPQAHFKLLRNPHTAMNGTIILSSSPPPCSASEHLEASESSLGGGFAARLMITQSAGPPPTATQWHADLAMAIQQTFAAYGVYAAPHPDGVAISSSGGGLAGGFALVYERPPEP